MVRHSGSVVQWCSHNKVFTLFRLSLGGGQEVFITVRVAESDYFRREGQDIHTTAFISLSQALLGGVIRIAGLHGDLNLRIPQVTQSF